MGKSLSDIFKNSAYSLFFLQIGVIIFCALLAFILIIIWRFWYGL